MTKLTTLSLAGRLSSGHLSLAQLSSALLSSAQLSSAQLSSAQHRRRRKKHIHKSIHDVEMPSRKIFWVVIKRLIGVSRTPLFATTKWLKHVIKHVLGVCVIQHVDIQLLCDQIDHSEKEYT